MAQFISARQFRSGLEQENTLPMIFQTKGLEVQHRIFSSEFAYHHLIHDIYEVTNTTDRTLPHFLIPCGAASLIIPLRVPEDHSVFCGTMTSMRRVMIPPRAAIFVVRFRDGSGEWLAGNRTAELTDGYCPLSDFIPEAEQLEAWMRRGESRHERMLQLFHILSEHQGGDYRTTAAMERCVGMVYRKHGVITIHEMSEKVGCSDRYLNKLFRHYMGITTKVFCELIQLQYSLNHIVTSNPHSLLQVAVEHGYFDQTHMNRYYRKFLKCTASDMRHPEDMLEKIPELRLFAK